MYNVSASATWLRIAAVFFALATIIAIAFQLSGIGFGFVIGIGIATIYYAALGVGLIVIGARLRCVLAENLSRGANAARRTQATVSVLQIMAGSSCAVFVGASVASTVLGAQGLAPRAALVIARLALATCGAVITHAVGVTSTSTDDGVPPASPTGGSVSSKGGARAPGLGRSAAIAPFGGRGASAGGGGGDSEFEGSLVDDGDTLPQPEAGRQPSTSQALTSSGRSMSTTRGNAASAGPATAGAVGTRPGGPTVDTGNWNMENPYEVKGLGRVVHVREARPRPTQSQAQASSTSEMPRAATADTDPEQGGIAPSQGQPASLRASASGAPAGISTGVAADARLGGADVTSAPGPGALSSEFGAGESGAGTRTPLGPSRAKLPA